MTDDRRRAAGSAPPSAEPAPGDTLPYAATVATPRAQGSQLSPGPAASPPPATPAGSLPPPSPPPQALAYAPTVTPQLAGSTVDILPPSARGSAWEEPAPAPLSLEPGQQIGRFVIRKRLGEGGMGIVLAGHDADLGRPVAIKLVRSEADRPAYRARLLREAQAMARLEHRNVVRVYEVGRDRGRLFVAMELVDGFTLTAWLAGKRRPWREVVAMFAQIGAGLAAAHRAGLVHRDFKPDNVLIDREGHARVADFGLARFDPDAPGAAAPAHAVSLTRSGMMMGTPGYMAPEQQAGSAVDARADQFSYCVALREALLGGRVVRLDRATWSHVPRALRGIVERGLAFEPGERFASMDALLDALGRVERRGGAAVSVAIAAVAIAGGIATTALVMSRGRGAGHGPPQAAPAGSGSGSGSAAAPAPSPSQQQQPQLPPPRPSVTAIDPTAAAGDLPAAAAAGVSPPRPAPVARAPRNPPSPPSSPDLAVVSATIAGLGYDGFDPAITAAAVDQLSGMEQVIAKVKLGMAERRAGRCAVAVPLWNEARQVIPPRSSDASKWYARATIGQSLCALAAGRPDDANQLATASWGEGNEDEIRLILGLVQYEKGAMPAAQAMFLNARQTGGPTVRAAAQIWLDRTGPTPP